MLWILKCKDKGKYIMNVNIVEYVGDFNSFKEGFLCEMFVIWLGEGVIFFFLLRIVKNIDRCYRKIRNYLIL